MNMHNTMTDGKALPQYEMAPMSTLPAGPQALDPEQVQANAPCAGCARFLARRPGDWKECVHPDAQGTGRTAMRFFAEAVKALDEGRKCPMWKEAA